MRKPAKAKLCLVTSGKRCPHEADSRMAWSQRLLNNGKLSSAKAMVSGMALPESVNFGSKWAEISADDGKN